MLPGDFDLMKQLGESIRISFRIIRAAQIFMQGAVEPLFNSLTCRDNETSKRVFQLLLERKAISDLCPKTE